MNYKILLVDDDPDFLEWLCYGLRKDGNFDVYNALSVKDAEEFLKKTTPDLAVIDIKLPDSDGFELTKLIRQNAATASLPVILITGIYKEVEYKEKGYALGADDFLVKPFSYEQFLIRVNKQLQNRRLDRQNVAEN